MFSYFISNDFDYSKMICSDAGPMYANDMGWNVYKIDQIYTSKDQIVIVDNRVTESECYELEKIIDKMIDKIFFLKIVDPCFESNFNHWYFIFLFKQACKKNVYYISNYEPKELTNLLDNVTNNNKIIFLPYPYIEEREMKFPISQRRNKLIISGTMNKNIYPYRYKIWLSTRRHFVRQFTTVLQHPGYADIGMKPKHQIIKENYLIELIKYKFMFVTPSRCELDLLKYNECAYAGCLPVGLSPSTYPDELKSLVFYIDPKKLLRSFLKLRSFSNKEIEEKVSIFRSFLRQNRNPKVLNLKLKSFLKNNL